MKIGVVQVRPYKGDLRKNIDIHLQWIDAAIVKSARAIFFPELSLTGYEPGLADTLAASAGDHSFDVFQEWSDSASVLIGAGMPLRTPKGVLIGMLLFQPRLPRQVYAKQRLHEDEIPYFVGGQGQVWLASETVIAPAICYESLFEEHAEAAVRGGAAVYLASVAKSAAGVEKAYAHYPLMARKFGITVLMVNAVGPSDNFVSAGRSGAWDERGELAGSLDEAAEGLLVFDTATRRLC